MTIQFFTNDPGSFMSTRCNLKENCHRRLYHQIGPTEIHVYAAGIIANKCGRLKGVI